jgi:hypothetical protein
MARAGVLVAGIAEADDQPVDLAPAALAAEQAHGVQLLV